MSIDYEKGEELRKEIQRLTERCNHREESDPGLWALEDLLELLTRHRQDRLPLKYAVGRVCILTSDLVGDVVDPLFRRQRPFDECLQMIALVDEVTALMLESGVVEIAEPTHLECLIRPYARAVFNPSPEFLLAWEARAVELLSDPDGNFNEFVACHLLRNPLFGELQLSRGYYEAWLFTAESFSARTWKRYGASVYDDIGRLLLRPRILGEELTASFREYRLKTFGDHMPNAFLSRQKAAR